MGSICALFQEYEQAAKDSFDPAFLNGNHILAIAETAQLCEENIRMLRSFLDDAGDGILFFIWRLYHLQFCTNEDFSDNIWPLDEITMPEDVFAVKRQPLGNLVPQNDFQALVLNPQAMGRGV